MFRKEIWKAGIEVDNSTVAQRVNTTLYALFSNLRDDWKYGISPCGISTNGYNGHVGIESLYLKTINFIHKQNKSSHRFSGTGEFKFLHFLKNTLQT